LAIAKNKKVYVAGHRGLVGSAIVRRLAADGVENIVTRTHQELDLREQADVRAFFAEERPDMVVLAAAFVGGIYANDTLPADFIGQNLMIQTNVIDAAYRSGVEKLLFLGSACIYPREAPQPMTEDMLLSGPLEPTNEWYAVAKIAGAKMCEAYRRQFGFDAITAMPNNLYGPGDNFDLEKSHVIPALIRKFHEAKVSGAKEAVVWGTGTVRREFLYVEDAADACVFLLEHYSEDKMVNIGTSTDVTIAELAALLREVVGFQGDLVFDPSKPDGVPRKLLDSSRVQAMGWQAKTDLRVGLEKTYAWFVENIDQARTGPRHG
jgi:GDP-L-fucose synthase